MWQSQINFGIIIIIFFFFKIEEKKVFSFFTNPITNKFYHYSKFKSILILSNFITSSIVLWICIYTFRKSGIFIKLLKHQ